MTYKGLQASLYTIYPPGTILRIKKTGEFARVHSHATLDDNTFLNYHVEIEGKDGLWVLYPADAELESL